jgi:non-specific serine/threonine protein kinase/serine/threonine-protein kinase
MLDHAKDAEAIFLAALEKEAPQERAAYVEKACAGQPDLRRRLRELLEAHEESRGPLDSPPVGLQVITHLAAITERPGTVLGPYKLLEQIGEGGMGLVFVAEQQRPVRRRVALKLIKPGMDSKQVLARFEAERQALALMDHPHIARVHDGGTTDSGRPYFVMELAKGVPITDYCDQNCLTPRQRLGLFLDVCAAVQHAHQKGIIHRDLKPSNIMVTVHDVTPVVKVIDFGIAKATGAQLTDQTTYTHFAQMVGTPLYMSPEQAGLSGLDVDTRSDVYSLGVLLYELLTGTTPCAAEALKRAGQDELRRIIREDEPTRPSARLSTLALAELSTVAERRGADPKKLSQAVRGELDWIVMRCLEKDRNRRYESASALAADVQRYLNDEAVQACPPSAGYRLRKLAWRNRRSLVTAGVILGALVAAIAVSAWQAVVAREAQYQAESDRDRAQSAERKSKADQERAQAAERHAATEAAIAQAVNDFLQTDLLGQATTSPLSGQKIEGKPNLTVREALDRAAARIGTRFQDQPLVEAAIQTTIGESYRSLYEEQLGVAHLERAFKLREANLGPDHPDTIDSMNRLASAFKWVGQLPDSLALYQQILKIRKARLGPAHPETLICIHHLAVAYSAAGQWDKSLPLFEELLIKRRTICGVAHPHTLGTMHALAMNYQYVNQLANSIDLHEKLLQLIAITNRPEDGPPIFELGTFGVACQRAGNLEHADQLFRAVVAHYRGQNDFRGRIGLGSNLGWLGQNLLLQKRYDEATPILREALALFEKELPNDHRGFFWMSALGGVLCGQQKYAEAEPLLLRGYKGMKKQEAIMHANWKCRMGEAAERVARFYEITRQPEKARPWREKVQNGLPALPASSAP